MNGIAKYVALVVVAVSALFWAGYNYRTIAEDDIHLSKIETKQDEMIQRLTRMETEQQGNKEILDYLRDRWRELPPEEKVR